MDSEKVSAFFCGVFLTAVISFVVAIFILIRPNTEISQEILRDVQQSTIIVEALKKENLVIRDVYGGSEADTVEIIVEYDFLYKKSHFKK